MSELPRPVLPQCTVLGGKYRIDDVIGRGGFGVVYRATQVDLGRSVAIKTLHGTRLDPDTLMRFEREARATSSLGHPHIVQVTDFRFDDPPFIVMELLLGRPLSALLPTGERLPMQRAARIAIQVLSGLEAAHRIGIVHRDVKPANIFLVRTATGDDMVKVLDFGIAKDVSGTGASGSTMTGAIIGTVGYMAPEQAMGLAVDARADVYAVGCVLYRMLAGRSAIPANNVPELLRVLAHGAVVPIERHDPNLPPALASVVARALAADPDARFPSADAMAQALVGCATASIPPFTPVQVQVPGALESAPTVKHASRQTSAVAPSTHAPAASPNAPHRSGGALIVAGLGGAGALALLAGGTMLVLAQRHKEPASSSALDASATPVTTATAPATARAIIDASAVVVPTKVPTNAPTTAPTPVAPVVPVAPSSAVTPDANGPCQCIEPGLEHALCPAKSTAPACTCIEKGVPLCLDVRQVGTGRTCDNVTSRSGTHGGACTGAPTQGGRVGAGTLQGHWLCGACTNMPRRYRGANGAACSGYDDATGALLSGRLRCG